MVNTGKGRCQANNPETCIYHGSQSARITRMMRNKLITAQSVMQAAGSPNEKIEAKFMLEQAEDDYYATDEGFKRLTTHFEQSKASNSLSASNAAVLEEMLNRANSRRSFMEEASQLAS